MLGRVEILGLINNICTFLILLDAIRLILWLFLVIYLYFQIAEFLPLHILIETWFYYYY